MIKYLVIIWITFGITFDSLYYHYEIKDKQRLSQINQLETLIEKCLIKEGGIWNLQGYYFLCQATYMGVSDYHIYLKEK